MAKLHPPHVAELHVSQLKGQCRVVHYFIYCSFLKEQLEIDNNLRNFGLLVNIKNTLL